MKRRAAVTSALALVVLLAACSIVAGTRPPGEAETYVVKARSAESRPASGGPVIRVADIEVASHLRGVTITSAGGRVQTLVNTRFAAPIHEMVEDVIVDRLRSSGRFSTVLPSGDPGKADRTLRLQLRTFEVDVSGSQDLAIAGLDGTLTPEGERTLLATLHCRGDSAVRSREPEDLVSALEAALNAAVDALLVELTKAN